MDYDNQMTNGVDMDEMTRHLGFHWNQEDMPSFIPTHSIKEIYCSFHKLLPEFIYHSSVLEGFTYSLDEIKTLLSGMAVGGHKIAEQDQVLNLIGGSKYMIGRVEKNRFLVNKPQLSVLHAIVAKNKRLECGVFRGEGEQRDITPHVDLGKYGQYTPLPTVAGGYELYRVFGEGSQFINDSLKSPFEKAVVMFLFCSLQKFFFTSNTRVAYFMMNGMLMSKGIHPLIITKNKKSEFHEKMIEFYFTRYAKGIIDFLATCHPEYKKFKFDR